MFKMKTTLKVVSLWNRILQKYGFRPHTQPNSQKKARLFLRIELLSHLKGSVKPLLSIYHMDKDIITQNNLKREMMKTFNCNIEVINFLIQSNKTSVLSVFKGKII